MTDLQTISSYSGLLGVILATVAFATYLIGMDGRIDDLKKAVKDFEGSTMSKFVEREWCDVSKARKLDTIYQNDRGLPIELAVSVVSNQGHNQCRLVITVNDRSVLHQADHNKSATNYCAAALTIPPNSQYYVDLLSHTGDSQYIDSWWELKPSCDLTIDSAK